MGIPYYGGMKDAAHSTETRRTEDTMNTTTDFTPAVHTLLVTGHAQDLTYRNDAAPSIGYYNPETGLELRLYVATDAPTDECPHRFTVVSIEPDELAQITTVDYQGDDESEAIDMYLTLLSFTTTEPVPPCDCRRCNGTVPATLNSSH